MTPEQELTAIIGNIYYEIRHSWESRKEFQDRINAKRQGEEIVRTTKRMIESDKS